MENNRFKEGDRVFDIRYGWGHIAEAYLNFHVKVYFDSEKSAFWFDNISSRILSFTEYALDGYTAFRTEELPNKGDIVWIRNEFPSEWKIGHFRGKVDEEYWISSTNNAHCDAKGTEITTKNPYENEK